MPLLSTTGYILLSLMVQRRLEMTWLKQFYYFDNIRKNEFTANTYTLKNIASKANQHSYRFIAPKDDLKMSQSDQNIQNLCDSFINTNESMPIIFGFIQKTKTG